MRRAAPGVSRPARRGGRQGLPGLLLLCLPLLMQACGDEDVRWRATRDAVSATEADEQRDEERWRSYRLGVVESLDEMRTVLEGSPGTETVVDRNQAQDLLERIEILRDRFVVEATLPPQEAAGRRRELEGDFEALRSDVDAFLIRLGHDPADMAYWQDEEPR